MKLKFTLLAAFIVFCFTVKAQQLPNNSFENWSSNPTIPTGWWGWESYSPLVPNYFTFQDTSRVYGSYSVQIVSDTVSLPSTPGLPLPGVLTVGTATLNSSFALVTSGIPFAFRPDTLFFSYKYSSPGTDTALASLALTSGGTAAVLDINIPLQISPNWQSGFLVLTPYYVPNSTTPDTLRLTFFSSKSAIVIGSKLNIDGVGFGYSASSGVKNIKDEIGLKVYPNPASTELNIRADKNLAGSNVQIYNMNGQLVSTETLAGNANTVNLSGFSSGTYIYKIVDKQNNIIDQSKISVVK